MNSFGKIVTLQSIIALNAGTTISDCNTVNLESMSKLAVFKFDGTLSYIQSLCTVASLIGMTTGAIITSFLTKVSRKKLCIVASIVELAMNILDCFAIHWSVLFISRIIVGIFV